MRCITRKAACAAIVCAGMSLAGPASAEFYKGRTLNVVINFGAGGNTDVQARSLLRHMEKYIAGSPRIVVRNMPGAGGAVGANYMNKGARSDGTFMGVFTTPWMHELVGSDALTESLTKLVYIGAIGQQQVTHARKDIGIETPFDILKLEKPFKSAGHSASSSKDISINITMRMLGVKHDHVTGFASAGPIRRAIMQNEVQLTEDSAAGYFGGVVPNLIEPGVSIPVWQTGVFTPDGRHERSKALPPDIPTFTEVYQRKFGADARPEGLDFELYKKIVGSRAFLRTVVMPPGSPDVAVSSLRSAWLQVVKDEDYLEEYRKANNSNLEWTTGDEAERNIKETLTISPELLAHLRKTAGIAN